MKNFIVKITKNRNRFKIYINDTIHVSIRITELIAHHSYVESYGRDANYIIKFYTHSRVIKCTYDTNEKFIHILKQIDKYL